MRNRLAITRDEIRAKVGDFLGFGRDDDEWTADQQALIEDSVLSGLRMFYFPPPVNDEKYEWSFLEPRGDITFAADTYEYLMPEEFAGFVGDLTYTDTGALRGRIPVVGEEMIRRLRGNYPSTTGRPQYAALRPLKVDHSQPQRWQMIVYPTSDASTYTARYTFSLAPGALEQARPYPYGGPEHSETVLTACLAAAEQKVDYMPGVNSQAFAVQLAASIKADKQKRPRNLGYNRDLSDGYGDERISRHSDLVPVTVTYNRVEWGD